MPSVTRLAQDVAAKLRPTVTARSKQGWQWLSLRPKVVFWAGGLSIALAFLVFSGPTAAGAALLAWAALRQAATASDRHQEQTNADRQRRITESFSKAIEQLGSDKLEVRVGGIYTLERISRESESDHWPVMETLTRCAASAVLTRNRLGRYLEEDSGHASCRGPSRRRGGTTRQLAGLQVHLSGAVVIRQGRIERLACHAAT
jgi:hypothetical protein